MKIRRRLLAASAGIILMVVTIVAVDAYWKHKQVPFQNTEKLISALQAYVNDQRAGGRPFPAEITLQGLIRGGYLSSNDALAFEGIDLAFRTDALDREPQMILARARLPDGQILCVLADGSVQAFTAARYQEALRKNAP